MTHEQLMVNSAIANWKLTIKRTSGVFDGLSDEQFFAEIAPGRNRPVYLLGHLTAVNDAMLPLLGLGERMHPELDAIFIKAPDRAVDALPALADLKGYWTELNALLIERFEALSPEEWIARHTAMTDEDYAADPSRNRFNVLLGRTAHMAMHMGQLLYARKKA
jgi:hypothetical protein